MRFLGQGATEYLVLLAVVLIVALVSVALLGFFPGMASDAQLTQSDTYWKSASPISLVEMKAHYDAGTGRNYAFPYLRIRNSGVYPIRITKILGNGEYIGVFFCHTGKCWNGGVQGLYPIQSAFYLGPGEEKYFSSYTISPDYMFAVLKYSQGASANHEIYAADQLCGDNADPTTGRVVIRNFGFEYIEYIEGQQITKREIGAKPLVLSCGMI